MLERGLCHERDRYQQRTFEITFIVPCRRPKMGV